MKLINWKHVNSDNDIYSVDLGNQFEARVFVNPHKKNITLHILKRSYTGIECYLYTNNDGKEKITKNKLCENWKETLNSQLVMIIRRELVSYTENVINDAEKALGIEYSKE